MATNYGQDLSCDSDLDPLMRLVTGEELMSQVCLHRLYCRQGRNLANPVDNTLDARDFVGRGIKPGDEVTIAGQCSSALVGDPRIATARVIATFDSVTEILTLDITGNGALGPFDLTLSVSAVTIELLRA